jgi:hypothetical protein
MKNQKQPHTCTQEQLIEARLNWKKAEYEDRTREHLDATMQKLVESHDFNSNPSRSAKYVTSYSKNKILLDIWNQFVAYEEAIAEQVFGVNAPEYFGEMESFDMVNIFSDYLKGYLEEFLSNDPQNK